MSDIVERLRANMDKYPGFENMNTEAATEIERLRARVVKLEADRDSWWLLGVEVKDMIGRLDAGGQLTKQEIERLRALVYRADVRTGEVGNE